MAETRSPEPAHTDDPLTAGVALAVALVCFVLLSVVGTHQRVILSGSASDLLDGLRLGAIIALPLVPLVGGMVLGRLTHGNPVAPGLLAGGLATFAAAAAAGSVVAAVAASEDYVGLLALGGRGVDEHTMAAPLASAVIQGIRYGWTGLWIATLAGSALGGLGAWILGSRRSWRPAGQDPVLRGLAAAHTLWVTGLCAVAAVLAMAVLSRAVEERMGADPTDIFLLVGLSLMACTVLAQWIGWRAAVDLARRRQFLVPWAMGITSLIASILWLVAGVALQSLEGWLLCGPTAATSLVGLAWLAASRATPRPKLRVGWPTVLGTVAASGLALGVGITLPTGFGLVVATLVLPGIDVLYWGSTAPPMGWVEEALVRTWQLQGLATAAQWLGGAATAGALAALAAAGESWGRNKARAAGFLVAFLVATVALPTALTLGIRAWLDRDDLWAEQLPARIPGALEPADLERGQRLALDAMVAAALRGRPELLLTGEAELVYRNTLEEEVLLALLDALEGRPSQVHWERARGLAIDREDARAQVMRAWPEEAALLTALEEDDDPFLVLLHAALAAEGRSAEPEPAIAALADLLPKATWPALVDVARAEADGDLDAVDARVAELTGWRGSIDPVLTAAQARAHLRLDDDAGAAALLADLPDWAWQVPELAGAAVAAGAATADQALVVRGWTALQEAPPSLRAARTAVEGCAGVGKHHDARALLAALGSREEALPAEDLMALDALLDASVGRGVPSRDPCLALAQDQQWSEVLAEGSPCTHYGTHRGARAWAHAHQARRGRRSEREAHAEAAAALWPQPDEGLHP